MTEPAEQVRIVIADDHQVVRAGFAELLDTRPDFSVVGTARTAPRRCDCAASCSPTSS